MKATVGLVASVVGVLVGSFSATASADVACRTTEDSNNAVVHLYNFTPPASGTLAYTVGNFDFFGSSAVGACVHDSATNSNTLYVIVDASNNLLGWLPKLFNHLCLTGLPDNTTVVQQTQTVCGVSMSPLNYNGNTLVQYGQNGADILRGGNGIDILYGGASNDSMTDYLSAGTNGVYYAEEYGESGNDILIGSAGNSTQLHGGPGNDNLHDIGGNADFLAGDDGNECCMWDSNNTYNVFDCGSGTDHVNTLAGSQPKTSCEVVDATCTSGSTNFCP